MNRVEELLDAYIKARGKCEACGTDLGYREAIFIAREGRRPKVKCAKCYSIVEGKVATISGDC